MADPRNFTFFVEYDEITVRFVGAKKLGRLDAGHTVGGDYRDRVIRLPRFEFERGLRNTLLHELGHYLFERQEIDLKDVTEEDICDVLTWLPTVLHDPRNDDLRAFLGLEIRDA